MNRLVVISLILCLAFALTSATVFAQLDAFSQSGHESFLIVPWAQDEITVSTHEELILATGWAACTRGLVQSYITAAHYQWNLDGDPILPDEETAQYFGPIEPRGEPEWCLVGNGTVWGSSWRYSIGTLSPGTYEITLLHWLDHPVIDGGDWDGDGRIDLFEGEWADETVTVHVVE